MKDSGQLPSIKDARRQNAASHDRELVNSYTVPAPARLCAKALQPGGLRAA